MSERDEQPGLNFEETTTHEGRERRIKMRPSGIFVFTDQQEPKPAETTLPSVVFKVGPISNHIKLRHITIPGKEPAKTLKITDPKLKLNLTRKA